MKKIVSIIIPTLNRKEFLSETLKSVTEQTYLHWECIVVDDGSTDGTDDFMEAYTQKNPKFKFFKRPENLNPGAGSCRNLGIELSTGNYIQFLDSDDLLGNTKLEEQVKILEQQDELTLLTCKWGYFTEMDDINRRFKHEYHSYKDFSPASKLLESFGKYNNFFPLHVYLFPKVILKKVGFWNEQLTNNDDGEFFLRIILSVSQVLFVPSAEVFYRLHSGTKLSDLDGKEKFEQAIKSWEYMEAYLKNKGIGKVGRKYINSGKRMVYIRAVKEEPQLIWEHYNFFKGFISLHERLIKKIF